MKTLIVNGSIWDGSGSAAYAGEVLIDGSRMWTRAA
jgi:hypothetical protein